jgi:kynureninase
MLKVEPDQGYIISTERICSLIDQHADELALILLPGIQYYSGQLLDIPTITAHAHSRGVIIGWDLAHAAGNVELKLHDWDVDFACWCTYKYMNCGAGAIAGAFVHEKHGDSAKNKALKGWYGHDKSSRFLMDNSESLPPDHDAFECANINAEFKPTPGAQGFQLSNPSIVDLTCVSASLSVFEQTSMEDLRSKSLLLTAYAEHLLNQIAERTFDGSYPFEIITPSDPLRRGAQLSVLLREELMEDLSKSLEAAGIICDKRKPGCIRVAPAPLYNTFSDICQFMQTFERAVRPKMQEPQEHNAEIKEAEVEARL